MHVNSGIWGTEKKAIVLENQHLVNNILGYFQTKTVIIVEMAIKSFQIHEDSSMPLFHTFVESPVNKLLLLSDSSHITGCYFDNAQNHQLIKSSIENKNLSIFINAKQQLQNYFQGTQKSFNLPLKFLHGTAFQKQIWEALKAIPYGKTISYLDLAKTLQAPKSARPIGGAIGKNPISIIIPCHRVIGSNGSLTGFGGGLAKKSLLLELETQIH